MTAIFDKPRRLLALISVSCIALLAFGLYLQHAVGLEPCPMCIVQRYLFILVALVAGLGAALPAAAARWMGGLMALLSLSGAFVAARQSWLQWFPPEVATCGRDFYGMIESFPLKRVIPMLFRGSGDCSAVDWTFLGLTIANWSFLNFMLVAALGAVLLLRRR
ncbi:disulfide bond formation protein B [Malikia sp.]|uniref:disulfide bond formation protein B n=1 Tax=Malikia sp. TaxID=2070706 RepID=UPI0026268EEF|nr:disulfide bond formation protein B [Malikia sp.]MDD2728742.1 disulfide bond formation protein B [Malikia sp.]